MQFMQICDRVEAIAGAPIDLSAFPGAWLNSNRTMNRQACAHTLDQSHQLYEP